MPKSRTDYSHVMIEQNPLRFGELNPATNVPRFVQSQMPSVAEYEKLLSSLGGQAVRLQKNGDHLEAYLQSLAAVIAFLEKDPVSAYFQLLAPLKKLAFDIHDLRNGGKPAHLKKSGRPPSHRPATAFNSLRGQIAAAYDALINAGFRHPEAGQHIERRLNALHVTLPNGDAIKAARIRKWRDELADPLLEQTFRRVTGQAKTIIGNAPTRERAMSWCETLLENVAAITFPDIPPA